MDLGIADRTAIVTAASQGLGRAVATSLSSDGANVVVCSRDEGRIRASAESIQGQTGGVVVPMKADVTSEADIDRIVTATLDRFGAVDILFTNSGGPPPGPFQGIDVATWEDGIRLNVLSTVLLCRAVVPGMVQRKRGSIVCLASVNTKHTIDGTILSNTTRAAVLGFAKSLATELAPHHVRVNVINPGYINTDRVVYLAGKQAESRGVAPSSITAQWEAAIPMDRLGEPEEFGDAVAFLCSDRASYITGVALQVDGGFVRAVG